jgi:hypothetical protein
MREADALEQAVWDELVKGLLEGDGGEALVRLDRAIGLREAAQGPMHSDLIWPLSLKIEILHLEHSRASTLAAARLGEQRLALRRLALREAPAELLRSLRELARLYTFEYEVLDLARVEALEQEIARLDPS